jgi:Holliday junction resolvase RusA-like endonuclease
VSEMQALVSGAAPRYEVNQFGCQFVVWGTPQPGGSKTSGRTLDGRTFVRDSNKKAAPWKDRVEQVAGALMANRELFRGSLSLSVTFYVPRPKSHYGVKGLLKSAPKYPITRPDITKLVRPLEDSLTSIVWKDDSQVVTQVARKLYGEPARAEVCISVLL